MPKQACRRCLYSAIASSIGILSTVVASSGCQITAESISPMPNSVKVNVTLLDSPVTSSLRGVHAITDDVCWASGSGGVWLRTTDGGESWQSSIVEGAAEIDFRDVHAFDADRAVLLTAGAPARVYLTRDSGEHWAIRHQDMREGVFFDSMAFWDDKRGIAFSDPVDGNFVIIISADGGIKWNPVPAEALPPAIGGEAGFAASGTCLAIGPDGNAWIGLGGDTGNPGSRVLHTADFGKTWAAHRTPISSTASAGIFSLVFIDESTGIAVGGDYLEQDNVQSNAATTSDGGRTWVAVESAPPTGYRSVVAAVDAPEFHALLAAGPSGIDLSTDQGRTWRRVSDEGFHAMSFAPGSSVGYATGANGRLARIELTR